MKILNVFLACCALITCNELYREEHGECGTQSNGSYTSNGRSEVFKANCAACHHPLKDATGPALQGVFETRSADWVFKFLTKEKFKPKDKQAKELKEKFGVSCMKFQLTKTEVDSLYAYIKSFKYVN